MFDAVINHISAHSAWFQAFKAGDPAYREFFITVDPAADLSCVVRPRTLPLLTPVETSRGTRHVWTTFSDDQIDLNYAEPAVLVEMIDILLFYLSQGARIVRLDAIAYLWKRLGTSCVHLDETHAVVKILRDLVEVLAPGAILLTETNVPHEENFSYFGDGDEARMVYQFSLAPLLLEAILTGDSRLLADWLAALEPTPPGTTTLNFTASHDGIGVRPLEGLMPIDRFERLLAAVERRGGRVSMKRNPDGADSPYELNITYFSAMDEPDEPDATQRESTQIARFLVLHKELDPDDDELTRTRKVRRGFIAEKYGVGMEAELGQIMGVEDDMVVAEEDSVLTDPEVLKTLPKRELVSGLQEIIKSAAIRSKSLLRYLERNLPAILACESQQMEHIVGEAAKIKAEVVSLDEKEGGLRTILNFGHTIGHAFETATDYRRFKHGEAVAWGMIAALEYGKELGMMDSGEADRLAQLVHRTGRLPSLQGISLRDLWSALARDKKFLAGDIRMVLLRNPGEAEIQSRIDPVSLKRFLKSFLSANTAGRT